MLGPIDLGFTTSWNHPFNPAALEAGGKVFKIGSKVIGKFTLVGTVGGSAIDLSCRFLGQ